MSESEIRTYKLEKHQTKDIIDKHVNGFLIPVWRDWDKTISVKPEMVYITSINPGERKGPHLHIIRHSYYVCIKGKVVFIAKENSGHYLEIESSEDEPILIKIPNNIPSAHINISKDVSTVLTLADVAWRPNDNEMINVKFDDYDFKKWQST